MGANRTRCKGAYAGLNRWRAWLAGRYSAKALLKPAALGMAALTLCLSAACSRPAQGGAPAAPALSPAPSIAVIAAEASAVSVDIANGSGLLCVVAAYDEAGAVVTSSTYNVTREWESARITLQLPATPAVYAIRAFLLDSGMNLLCQTPETTAAMYSETVSASRVTGVFIAPELSSAATETQWLAALQNMRELGVDTVIIQYCYQNDPRYGHQAYFPYAQEDTVPDAGWHPLRRSQIGAILSAAQQLEIKAYLGLQVAEYEWFDQNRYRNAEWLREQAAFSLRLAGSLWRAFGGQYADTIEGWYLPFEIESSREYQPYFQQIVEEYYAPLTHALKNSAAFGPMSVMISPLQYRSDDKAAWKANLSLLLSGSQIDVIAPQDGLGFGTQNHDTAGDWFSAVRETVDAVNDKYAKSISLWGNCENYSRLRNPDETDYTERIKPMCIGKFITSMDVAAPYTEKLVTFSIHRWDIALTESSAVNVNRPYYEAYQRFAKTGMKPVSRSDGYYVSIRAEGDGVLHLHSDADAGLTDGFAADPDDWRAYKGVSTDGNTPFIMEIRFDDPVGIQRVQSNYYEEKPAAIMLPQQVQYEYLVRSGDHDQILTYTLFHTDFLQNAAGVTRSEAALKTPVMADGIRLTVTPRGKWTFLDDIWVE